MEQNINLLIRLKKDIYTLFKSHNSALKWLNINYPSLLESEINYILTNYFYDLIKD